MKWNLFHYKQYTIVLKNATDHILICDIQSLTLYPLVYDFDSVEFYLLSLIKNIINLLKFSTFEFRNFEIFTKIFDLKQL